MTGCGQIILTNFLSKLVQSVSLCHFLWLSKKPNIIKIWLKVGQNKDLGKNSHSGSVPEDSGSLYESPVLDLKGGLWVFRKSQKIWTASETITVWVMFKRIGLTDQLGFVVMVWVFLWRWRLKNAYCLTTCTKKDETKTFILYLILLVFLFFLIKDQ